MIEIFHILSDLFKISRARLLFQYPSVNLNSFPRRKQPMTVENIRLYTIASVSTFLSHVSNPIVFYFTVNSFNKFVRVGISRCYNLFMRELSDKLCRRGDKKSRFHETSANNVLERDQTVITNQAISEM